MKVVVGFPWRPTPEREPLLAVVSAWYRHHLPDAEQLTMDAGGDTFNRAASRNLIADTAHEAAAEVVVISDADTIPTPAGLRSAINAAPAGGVHYPFDSYLYAGTDNPPGGNTGGIFVCRPDVWRSVGGMDPRFDGWGGEDDQLYHAAKALIGDPVHHPGWCVSLWHDPAVRDVGSPRWQPNSALARRYVDADAALVRSLIEERR